MFSRHDDEMLLRPCDTVRLCKSHCCSYEVRFATTYLDRLRGLFAYPNYWGCLVLMPCRSIHTFGMDGPIQIAFFDKHGVVIEAEDCVEPNEVRRNRNAWGVMERRVQTNSDGCRADICSWFEPDDELGLLRVIKKGYCDEHVNNCSK